MMESAEDRSDSDPTVPGRRLGKRCLQAEAAVALALALAKRPELLLLDDPAARPAAAATPQ
jgi:hypothetical protein